MRRHLFCSVATGSQLLAAEMINHLVAQDDLRVAVLTSVRQRALEIIYGGDWDVGHVFHCAGPLVCQLMDKKYDSRKRRCVSSFNPVGFGSSNHSFREKRMTS